MDTLGFQMYKKLVSLVDDARTTMSAPPAPGGSKDDGPRGRADPALNKWASPSNNLSMPPPWSLILTTTTPQFNLNSPQSALFRDVIRCSAPSVDTFELLVVLRIPKGSVLVYCVPESPGSSVEVIDPPDAIPLESWTISFSEYGDKGYQGSGLPEAYKQGTSIFRVAYTLLRWLPAWKLRNDLQRGIPSGKLEGFGIELRGQFHQAEYADTGCGGNLRFRIVYPNMLMLVTSEMDTFVQGRPGQSTSVWEFAPMELPIGSLKIRARYLTNPTFWIKRAHGVGKPSHEEILSSQLESRTLTSPTTQAAHAASSKRDGRLTRTRSSPTLAVSRRVLRDSSRRSVTIFCWDPPRSFSVGYRLHQPGRMPPTSRTDLSQSAVNRVRHELLSLFCSSRKSFPSVPLLYIANLAVVSSVLEYPPFNEIIHWDGINRVVLEQPQILESYILMPVFGIPTFDTFKRKLYVRVSYSQLNRPLIPWLYVMIDTRFRLRAS